MRGKVLGTLVVCIVGLILGAMMIARGAGGHYETKAQDALNASVGAVQHAHLLDEYSLASAAQLASLQTAISRGMQCPATEELLREASREQTPMVDAATGEPVRNAAGLVLDTDGQPIIEQAGPRCTQTQHAAVIAALRAWNDSQTSQRDAAAMMPPHERPLGLTLARVPDLLIAADANGQVVARIGNDTNNWFGPSRPNMSVFEPVAATELSAESGRATAHAGDIVWREYENADPVVASVGVAPIFAGEGDDATFVGTVMVGTFTNDEAVTDVADLMSGIDIVYWFRADGTTRRASSNSNMSPGLAEEVRGGSFNVRNSAGEIAEETLDFNAITSQSNESTYAVDVSRGRYLVRSLAFGRDDSGEALSGAVVVTSLTQASVPLRGYFSQLPLLGALLLVLGVVAILFAIKQFVEPIEEISRGVQEVIAGNKEYMWAVDDASHLADLSHSLNIMSARLQGKRDPDAEENEGGEGWGGGDSPAAPKAGGGIAGLRRRGESGTESE
jgi:hypothetical protein